MIPNLQCHSLESDGLHLGATKVEHVICTVLICPSCHIKNQGHGKKWCPCHRGCCGRRQSPIDIDTSKAEKVDNLDIPLIADGYDRSLKGSLANNGHTVQFTLNEGGSKNFTLSGGPLGKDKYRLVQFHYHWGSGNKPGSEHTLDGNRIDAEMHLVHVNAKYKTAKDAIKHHDGLAVVAFFLTTDGDEYNSTLPGTQERESILFSLIITLRSHVILFKDLARAREVSHDSATEGEFSLAELMGTAVNSGRRRYATYRGSLTTPGKDLSETFIVNVDQANFNYIVKLSKELSQS